MYGMALYVAWLNLDMQIDKNKKKYQGTHAFLVPRNVFPGSLSQDF